MSAHLSDRALRRLSWSMFCFAMVSYTLVVVTEVIDQDRALSRENIGPGDVVFLLTVASFPIAGLLITRQQPRNRIGWLLQAAGLLWALTAFQEVYVRLAVHLWPGHLPWAAAVEAVGSMMWWPAIVVMGVITVLHFPDGHLPSRGWRWVVWLAVVDCVAGVLLAVVTPGPLDGLPVPIPENPLGLPLSHSLITVLHGILLAGLPLSLLAAAVSIVVRFRGSAGVERHQLKWLMTAEVLIAAMFLILSLLPASTVDGHDAWWLAVTGAVTVGSFSLIPITIGVAVTRHGLYGIDALISRALVVGALGVFITVVYVGVVVGVGSLIGQRHPSVLLSVVATGVVAVAFQPVREKVTRVVNRVVYGSRATPYEVLSDFAASMAGTYTTAELLPRIAQTVSECLGGARVGIWLRSGRLMEREAGWPLDGTPAESVALLDPGRLSGPDGTRVVAVRHRDELLGALSVTKSAAEPVTPTEDDMLAHVASQTGLVLRNLRLVDDLQSSRQRLVTSQDDQRRRLERDLHDGAQQSLVAIALMLRMSTSRDDRDELSASATQAADALQGAIGELRELARGLHPAILTDRGLGAAVTGLTERCPVPVRLHSTLSRRLPGPVEGALYFVVAEALTNVVRYAGATRVDVRLSDLGETVTLEVSDDGAGGADATRGTGLTGLADRVAVVDGTFTVHSPPGQGTTLRCEAPLAVAVPEQRDASSTVPALTGSAR